MVIFDVFMCLTVGQLVDENMTTCLFESADLIGTFSLVFNSLLLKETPGVTTRGIY